MFLHGAEPRESKNSIQFKCSKMGQYFKVSRVQISDHLTDIKRMQYREDRLKIRIGFIKGRRTKIQTTPYRKKQKINRPKVGTSGHVSGQVKTGANRQVAACTRAPWGLAAVLLVWRGRVSFDGQRQIGNRKNRDGFLIQARRLVAWIGLAPRRLILIDH